MTRIFRPFNRDLFDFLGGVHDNPPGLDVIGHGCYMLGQAVAAKMLLLDDKQIDAVPFGDFANISGGLAVGGINGTVHAELVEYLLSFIDKHFGLGDRHKLGQISFSQFVNIVQFAV